MNLRYYYPEAYDTGNPEHAEEIMRKLGITYKEVTFHPIADCVIFYDCENIPEELPIYLKETKINWLTPAK